ncbi:hypothetical protein EMIT07CA2_170082 [Brevibacillus sp. IT-7CA2]
MTARGYFHTITTTTFLIKSGGGTGPTKPGNQQTSCMVPIPAESSDSER